MPRPEDAGAAAGRCAHARWFPRGCRSAGVMMPGALLVVASLALALLLTACAPRVNTPVTTGDQTVHPDPSGSTTRDPDAQGPTTRDPDAPSPADIDEPAPGDGPVPTEPDGPPVARRSQLETPVRAAWVHLFDDTLKTRAGIASMVRELEAARIEVLFAQVIRRHDAYYDSDVLPRSVDPMLAGDVDVLDELLTATDGTDIAVHAWYSVAPTDHGVYDELDTPDDWLATRHGRDAPVDDRWVTRDVDGVWSDYLDVGLPQVRDHVVTVVTELAERYPVAGIHLDYARYPSARHGYHPQVVARYQHESGANLRPSPDDPAFITWRQRQPTALVAAVREALHEVDPQLVLSAAVITWGDGPGGPGTPTFASTRPATEALQDWPSWIEQDLVDLVAPMNYFRAHEPNQAVWFERWVAYESELAGRHDTMIVPGIGAWLNQPDAVIDQVRHAVDSTDGASIYSVQQPSSGDDRAIWARLRTEAWPGSR